MKTLWLLIFTLCQLGLADTTITNLPAVAPSSVGSTDVFPFVNIGLNQTSKLQLSQILSIPSLQSPTFTGTVTGGIFTSASGTAGSPTIRFGDSTTGAYRSALNEFSIAAAGVQQLRVGNAFVGLPTTVFFNLIGTAGQTTNINTGSPSDILSITGDTVSSAGGGIKFFARDASPSHGTQFINANSITGSISNLGLWTIGISGGPQVHAVNGSLALTGGNVSFATSGKGVVGTATNDDAAAGNVGEYIESDSAGSFTNFAASTTWAAATSLSLTAGDWDVTGVVATALNSATPTQTEICINKNSASGTGCVEGNNFLEALVPVAATDSNIVIPAVRFSLSAPTSIYLNVNATYSGGHPQYAYRISARRMR